MILLAAAMASALLGLAACDRPVEDDPAPPAAEASTDAAKQEMAGETYEDVKGSADCTQDCSGHDAGFEWAKEHDIDDDGDCTGDSESFIEGCKAYVEELDRRTTEADSSAN